MAKEAEKSPFLTEKTEWGAQVKISPFAGISGTKNGTMSIVADVHRPKRADRRAEVRVWFAGVVGSASLSTAEMNIWINSVRGPMIEAQRIGEKMKAKPAAKAKPKRPKAATK